MSEIRELYEEAHKLLDHRRQVNAEVVGLFNNWQLRYEQAMNHYFKPDVYEDMRNAGLIKKRPVAIEWEPEAPVKELSGTSSIEDDIAALQEGKHKGKRNCGNCGFAGHRASNCPEAPKKDVLPMGKRGCGNCGKPGHRRTTCPN
jgi:hypothetical protein